MASPRRGARRAPSTRPSVRRVSLTYGGSVLASVIAWGFLVWMAIRFGAAARDGESGAWLWVALVGVGAAACLFLTILLITRAVSAIAGPPAEEGDRPVGGHRAARKLTDRSAGERI